jgi:hypothetical protein
MPQVTKNYIRKHKKSLFSLFFPALFPLLLLLLVLLCLFACSIDTRVKNDYDKASPPFFPQRELYLVFEREKDLTPLTHKKVNIKISSPTTLLYPPGGDAITDSQGAVYVVYTPVSRYDESAYKAGDLIIDYPATLYITMDLSDSDSFEWQIDDSLSFASYGDPLYQGLNREPDKGPSYINLILP